MKSKHTRLSLVLGLTLASSLSAYAAPIIGGEEIPSNDPSGASVVALAMRIAPSQNSPGGTALCTASIIRDDILVTAAHCVTDGDGKVADPKNLIVAFGNDLNSQSLQTRHVVAALASPKWRADASTGKDWGDIAVVKFTGGLPDGYVKAKMLAAKAILEEKEDVVLMGYGISTVTEPKQGDPETAGILRRVETPISDPKYGKAEVMLDQTAGKGACHGDSGGPAYVEQNGQLLLWGVTSRGGSVDPSADPNRCDGVSIYTRITGYSAFVNSTIKAFKTIGDSSPSSQPAPAFAFRN